jgi:hypothetical protein
VPLAPLNERLEPGADEVLPPLAVILLRLFGHLALFWRFCQEAIFGESLPWSGDQGKDSPRVKSLNSPHARCAWRDSDLH